MTSGATDAGTRLRAGPAALSSSALLISVRNAARVLRSFTSEDQELGVSEIARRLDLSTSTAHRLITTLEAEQLVERNRDTGKYRLSLALFELGRTVTTHLALHRAAQPALLALHHSTGEMVQVAVLDGAEVVFVERLESSRMVPVSRQIGLRVPAHSTSTGKVLLAALSRSEQIRRLAGKALAQSTIHTITDPTVLLQELDAVRRRGWASNLEESQIGVSSVGAPVRGADTSVRAAVSVVGNSDRVNPRTLPAYRTAVVEAAALISRRLGYRGPRVRVP